MNPIDACSKSFLVDLDAIMDTRLGTLMQLHPGLFEQCLALDYHLREAEVFPNVPMNIFKEVYDGRDRDTLKVSLITRIPDYIKIVVDSFKKNKILSKIDNKTIVDLNIYPYKLTDEEIQNYCEELSLKLGEDVIVRPVNYSPKDLTPTIVKNEYSCIIKYNFNTWLDEQAHAFNEIRAPEVTVLLPNIYWNEKPSEKELKEIKRDLGMSELECFEQISAPLLGIKLIDVVFYCAALPYVGIDEYMSDLKNTA